MRIRAIVVVGGTAVVGAFFAAHSWGCGSSNDTTQTEPVRQSRKGEACQVTGDCLQGLACQPIPGGAGGICVLGTFNVSVTARECVLSECSTPADCCSTPPPNCPQLLQECGDSGPTNVFCQEYAQFCKCDTTKRDCQNDRCVLHCSTDPECVASGGLPKCAAGTCVQCVNDGDCGSSGDLTCINGKCQAPCKGDGDCPGFQRCVESKCIESGCQTDRECIASTRNVESTCGTDGKCIVPCQTDLECGSPTSYSFFSCIANKCIYTGCQTDKDCRLLLTGPSDASTIGPKEHVVCRDKASPGQTTIPAQP